MQAIEDGGENRFSKAIKRLRELVREASGQQQMAILEAGSSPKVLVPFTGDERALLRGIETLQVTDAAGDLEKAIRLGDSLLASRKGRSRIVVLTDRIAPEPIAGIKTPVQFLQLGEPHDNVGITRFAARPLLSSPQTFEILLSIKNFGRTATAGNVELSVDGTLLDVKPLHIEPGQESVLVFPSVPRLTRSSR